MKNKVCCFGEVLLRFSPDTSSDWVAKQSMPFYFGGAELNVSIALATWDVPVKFVSSVPANYIAEGIITEVKRRGVDCSGVVLAGKRLGLYYLSEGADFKKKAVIYDRAYSSFYDIKVGMIDWRKELADCSWFHFSAICPAISNDIALVCKEALEVAQDMGIAISIDLNYRNKLWQYGKNPVDIMPELVKYCDVVMGNIWSAESLLGIASSIKSSEGKSDKELEVAALQSIEQVKTHYPKAQNIAYTFRLDSGYWAIIHSKNETAVSKTFSVKQLIDQVGSGDCFMAGIIYGLIKKNLPGDVINFAAAAAVGKLQVKGDSTNQHTKDIIKIIQHGGH